MKASPKDMRRPVSVELAKVDLKSDKELVVLRDIGRGILKWGVDNLQPTYYNSLYKHCPQHQGIVNGKAKYITGLSIKASTPHGQEWVDHWNPTQDAWEVLKPVNRGFTKYGIRAIKVVPNMVGIPLWFFHLNFAKCRISDCQTKIKYCVDWERVWFYGIEEFPIWHPGCREISVYLYLNEGDGTRAYEDVYGELEYEGCLKDIDTLARVSNSRNSLVQNDFSGGTVLNIFGGKPETVEEQKKLANATRRNYGGDEQQGTIPVIYGDENGKAAEFSVIPTNGLDKKYLEMTDSTIKNVYAGHNVPAELFGYISSTGTLFDKNKLAEQQERFMNDYVIPAQQPVINMLEMFYELRFPGQECEFEIEQFDPIGMDLPLDNQAVVTSLNTLNPQIIPNYLVNKFKLPVMMPNDQAGSPIQSMLPVAQTQAPVNDHLKNLTGKQNQNIQRIVRDFKNGKTVEAQAKILLKPYGLTDQEIKEFLGTKLPPAGQLPIQQRIAFAKQVDFFALVDKYAHDINDSDEILQTSFYANTINFGAIDAIRTALLIKIKNNPAATVEDLASALGVNASVINDNLSWLTEKKLLSGVAGSFKPKDKKLVVYTEYHYGLSSEATGDVILSTTRDWCKQMYRKYAEGKKALSFEAINAMSDDMGLNAWDYRGGFTNWKGGETTPYCRHTWIGVTKSRFE